MNENQKTVIPHPLDEFVMQYIRQRITVCILDSESGSISQAYGNMDDIDELRKEIESGECNHWFEPYVPCEEIIVIAKSYVPGETQYGSGYGDVYNIPGYIEWEIVKRSSYV